jgi:hypothetical protein
MGCFSKGSIEIVSDEIVGEENTLQKEEEEDATIQLEE